MWRKSSLSKRRGDYGKRKYKVFTLLWSIANTQGRDGYLSTKELVIYSGIPYRSLTRCLPDWVEWGYVEKRPVTGGVKRIGDFEYKILDHGISWLTLARDKLRNKNKFQTELKAQYTFGSRNFEVLIGMSFNQLVHTLKQIKDGVPQGRLHTAYITWSDERRRYEVDYLIDSEWG